MAITVEFAVIGAGLAGSASARALARAGREVILFERFHVGNTRGSSHGASRIFRFSYDDAHYVRMAMAALPLWRELEEETGAELLTVTGGLDRGKSLDDHVDALGGCGARYELLTGGEVTDRFPSVALSRDEPVLFQPDAGIAHAEAALRAFVESAQSHGAALHENTTVNRVTALEDAVTVDTDEETYRARVAVVTAGGWARPLLAGAGIDLPVVPTRETVAYFALADELSTPTLVDWGDPVFFALASPGQGLKAGFHHAGPLTEPSEPGQVSTEIVERLSACVAERYPDADPVAHHAETCIYTNTDDERFILERHGPIVVGSACSGHGFKFGPLTGKLLADLATGTTSTVPDEVAAQ
jgi:sarcosine oxidase